MAPGDVSPDGILDEIFIGEFDDEGFELEQATSTALVVAGRSRLAGGTTGSVTAGERDTRWKAVRAVASLAIFVMVGLALLGGPRVALGLLGRLTPFGESAEAEMALALPDLVQTRLPVGAWRYPTVRVAPVNGPANMAYACWVNEPGRLVGQQEAELMLVAFDAGRQTWRTLATPARQGASCDVAANLDGSASAVVAVGHARQSGNPCPLPDLFATGDGGTTWRAVPWPAGAGGACQVRMTLEGGRLYVRGNMRLLRDATGGESGRFLVTADGGRTWRAADADLADVIDFTPLAFRPGGRVLAEGVEPGRPDRTSLWESADAGAHWTRLGLVPIDEASVVASSDPAATGAGGWGRLYAYGTAEGTAIPGEDGAQLWASGVARVPWAPTALDGDGSPVSAWTRLQGPPGPGAALSLPAGEWLPDAGEGPGGSLLVAWPTLAFQSRVTLSLWTGRNQPGAQYTLPPGTVPQGVSWYQGQMRVWATLAHAGQGRETQVAVFTLPAQS